MTTLADFRETAQKIFRALEIPVYTMRHLRAVTEILAATEHDVLPCHRCLENHPTASHIIQTYSVVDDKTGTDLLINVTAAYQFARAVLTPIEIPKEHHNWLMLVNMSETFCGAHVEHVDRTKPAIIGTLDGRIMLMDGTHRLFAWIKHNEPPLAYCLDDKQTIQFVMRKR